jgi:hypothetical protein
VTEGATSDVGPIKGLEGAISSNMHKTGVKTESFATGEYDLHGVHEGRAKDASPVNELGDEAGGFSWEEPAGREGKCMFKSIAKKNLV